MYKTHQYRIKDSSKINKLKSLSGKVNHIWNHCNAYSSESWKEYGVWIQKYDAQNFFAGLSKEISLNSATVQLITHEHSNRRNQFKRCKLNWRSRKRKTLGWIPFDVRNIKVTSDIAKFMGLKFKFWKHREHEKVVFGSFSENAKGQWFLNLCCKFEPKKTLTKDKVCGIDLGLSKVATLSSGENFDASKPTRKYAEKLAVAQRAKNKRQVTNLHNKIKNIRKDRNHKISRKIVDKYDYIVVGDLKSKALIRKGKGFAKSTTDVAFGQLRTMLEYKALWLGKRFQTVSEENSTITCSACLEKSGPSGLSGLGIRSWKCSSCGTHHIRDVNSAKNILNFGLGQETLQRSQ